MVVLLDEENTENAQLLLLWKIDFVSGVDTDQRFNVLAKKLFRLESLHIWWQGIRACWPRAGNFDRLLVDLVLRWFILLLKYRGLPLVASTSTLYKAWRWLCSSIKKSTQHFFQSTWLPRVISPFMISFHLLFVFAFLTRALADIKFAR